jgi:hypothetical protein
VVVENTISLRLDGLRWWRLKSAGYALATIAVKTGEESCAKTGQDLRNLWTRVAVNFAALTPPAYDTRGRRRLTDGSKRRKHFVCLR